MNSNVVVPTIPQRIISLVPSQTELLYDLGVGERVIGVTKFCVHPKEQVKNCQKIGGTKNFNFQTIETLQPDLIIGNKEENYPEGINKLKEIYPVWMSDIYTLSDALNMIESIGEIVNAKDQAYTLINDITDSFNGAEVKQKKTAVYLIWRNPYMVAGNNTFIHDMMNHAGFKNAITEPRYPEVKLEDLKKLNPDNIFLSSEPYPFKNHHIDELETFFPNSIIQIVDGEMFSWYGSRLKHAASYFKSLH